MCGVAPNISLWTSPSTNQLDLHRIHSGCAISNVASIKVLERAGLKREGTTRESFPMGDELVDYAIFGIPGSDWRRT